MRPGQGRATGILRGGVRLAVTLALGGVLAAACSTHQGGREASEDLSEVFRRGQYLATIMDCNGCHTPGALAGQPDTSRRLAGSQIGFAFPGGVVYPPNLTPDPETGLGRWTDAEIGRAIRQGRGRDGRALVPIMPWPSYAVLTDRDVAALVAYLRTLPPVRLAPPRPVGPGQKPTAPFLGVVEPR